MFRNVLLIQPPSSSYLGAIRPPTGLGYISQVLLENDIEHQVADLRIRFKFSALKMKINSFHPDLIGISMVSFEYKRSYELIRKIKQLFPDIAIVVGGPHISIMGGTALQECPEIDFGIVHEGESSMVQLCRGNVQYSQIPGLIYRSDGEVCFGPKQLIQMDLDKISFPRYEMFDRKLYAKEISFVTSRGCPYKCIFCPNSLTAKKFRARSASSVADEIEYWYGKGIKQLNVDDDNFTLNKHRVYEICDEIERRGMKDLFIRCSNGLRADRVDRDLLTRMKHVGIREVAFGADGGNDRVLRDVIQKGEKLDDIERAISDALAIGLRVKVFIIVGCPGETISDIEDSMALAQRYPVEWVHLNNPIPYPGTKLYEWVESHNSFIIPPEQYLNKVTETDNTPVFETPELSREVRKGYLARCRKIEKEVKRRAVERMFHEFPVIGYFAGLVFASSLGQKVFFKFMFARSIINRIWYRKMVSDD